MSPQAFLSLAAIFYEKALHTYAAVTPSLPVSQQISANNVNSANIAQKQHIQILDFHRKSMGNTYLIFAKKQ